MNKNKKMKNKQDIELIKHIAEELKPLLVQQSEHFSFIVKDLNDTKKTLAKHLETYTKNGKEFARMAVALELTVDTVKDLQKAIKANSDAVIKLNFENQEIIDIKKATDKNTEYIDKTKGAVSFIKFIGFSNIIMIVGSLIILYFK